MGKSTRAEVERRVDELYDLMINRISYRAIVGHCQRKWGIGERQVCIYLAKVRERLALLAEPNQRDQLVKAIASYESLYAKQVAAGRLSDARQTLDSLVRLQGLAAPERLELLDFANLSDKQLAAEVYRELPELIREATRLAGGTAAADADAPPEPDALDPPPPDA